MQMDATQITVAIIALIGTVLSSASLGKSLWSFLVNRGRRKRALRASLEDRVDFEAARRRKFQEYAARLRRQMVESGIAEDDIQPWPPDTNYMKEEPPL